MEQPDEPLHISAPIAWEMAPRLCYRDPATGENCAWNHGFWQILRMMGLAGSASDRGAFYRRVINSVAVERTVPQILISGSADYAMLAQVLLAGHEMRRMPSVTVVDVCDTPLYFNRWYAERQGVAIDTCRSDILRFDTDARFDIVCTDFFLGLLPPSAWPMLTQRWASLLRPGGKIVTANRVRPSDAPERVRFSGQQVTDLIRKVGQWATTEGASFSVDASALHQAADLYGSRNMLYAVRSADDIRRYFVAAGLEIEEFSVTADSASSGVAGPTMNTRANGSLMEIVARKP